MTTIVAHLLNVAVWMEVGEILEGIILVVEEGVMVVGTVTVVGRGVLTWALQPTCPQRRWSRS